MTHSTRRGFLQSAALGAAALASGPGLLHAAKGEAKSDAPAGGPKFHLGMISYNVGATWDLPTLLKVCKNAGIWGVECRTTHKHGVEPTLTKDQRKDVKKQFADAGVVFWGCGSVCEFQSPDAKVVQKQIEDCKQFCDLVADLGGKGVKVRPNGLPKGDIPLEKTLEQIGKSLTTCGQAAESAGVEIFLEVHGATTQIPAHCKTIMEACNHPKVGVCWNSNPTDVKDGSVAENFKLLRPWLKSCHINDLWKDSAGVYPYRELFKLMRETDYDRVTLCEVGTTFTDPAAGEQFMKHYKALWTELCK